MYKPLHPEPHPLADKFVLLNSRTVDTVRGIVVEGAKFRVIDWWDRDGQGSWMWAMNNPAAMMYGMRGGLQENPLPTDNEVVYGHIGAFGHLVHASELGEVVEAP